MQPQNNTLSEWYLYVRIPKVTECYVPLLQQILHYMACKSATVVINVYLNTNALKKQNTTKLLHVCTAHYTVDIWCCMRRKDVQGPTLLLTKIPGLSRTVKMFFQDVLGARQCLNVKTNRRQITGCMAYGTPNILNFISSLYFST